MSKSDLKEFVDYVPAQLTESKRWYITYYVKNPVTGELTRKSIKCNRINSVTERRKLYHSRFIWQYLHKVGNE